MVRPLEGIKVVEVSTWAYVPSCGAALADMGADVVKIEPPAGELPAFGYIDAHFKQPFRLTLKDPKSLADAMPEACRR